MTYITQRTKLFDCARHDRESELMIVEGDSASKTVARIRDPSFQAVLPMQGKPMNAVKSSRRAIIKNLWFAALVDAMRMGWDDGYLERLRYGRVLLLFDPDADGIHCGALTLLFFETFFPGLIDAKRLSLIKPPLFEITAPGYQDSLQAYSEEHLQRIHAALSSRGIPHSHRRYRGLASINDAVLRETCIDPNSRTAYLMSRQDAASARDLFGGGRRHLPANSANSTPFNPNQQDTAG
jgi:DNA gyrase/topoisomerase IV subunit B